MPKRNSLRIRSFFTRNNGEVKSGKPNEIPQKTNNNQKNFGSELGTQYNYEIDRQVKRKDANNGTTVETDNVNVSVRTYTLNDLASADPVEDEILTWRDQIIGPNGECVILRATRSKAMNTIEMASMRYVEGCVALKLNDHHIENRNNVAREAPVVEPSRDVPYDGDGRKDTVMRIVVTGTSQGPGQKTPAGFRSEKIIELKSTFEDCGEACTQFEKEFAVFDNKVAKDASPGSFDGDEETLATERSSMYSEEEDGPKIEEVEEAKEETDAADVRMTAIHEEPEEKPDNGPLVSSSEQQEEIEKLDEGTLVSTQQDQTGETHDDDLVPLSTPQHEESKTPDDSLIPSSAVPSSEQGDQEKQPEDGTLDQKVLDTDTETSIMETLTSKQPEDGTLDEEVLDTDTETPVMEALTSTQLVADATLEVEEKEVELEAKEVLSEDTAISGGSVTQDASVGSLKIHLEEQSRYDSLSSDFSVDEPADRRGKYYRDSWSQHKGAKGSRKASLYRFDAGTIISERSVSWIDATRRRSCRRISTHDTACIGRTFSCDDNGHDGYPGCMGFVSPPTNNHFVQCEIIRSVHGDEHPAMNRGNCLARYAEPSNACGHCYSNCRNRDGKSGRWNEFNEFSSKDYCTAKINPSFGSLQEPFMRHQFCGKNNSQGYSITGEALENCVQNRSSRNNASNQYYLNSNNAENVDRRYCWCSNAHNQHNANMFYCATANHMVCQRPVKYGYTFSTWY